jgi:hypothetical protein
MPLPTNIIGEPLEEYVHDEISHRQSWQYSGYDSNRSNQQIQYLNNKNAWVKLASSVEIGVENTSSSASETNLGKTRLEDIGFSSPENFLGSELAKQFTLFNTTSEVNKPNSRSGIAKNLTGEEEKRLKLWNKDSSYGLGGSEFGLQPSPGIKSINIDCLNRGSIRKATIELKAYNKFQFELIELLYLRIGFHVLLEWGNDRYYNQEDKKYQNTGTSILEDKWFNDSSFTQLTMLREIEKYRAEYSGNYDGFFGRVVNFDWSFSNDGSYDISLQLVTVGDIIESLQVNLPSQIRQKVELINSGSKNSETKLDEELDNVIDDWLYSKQDAAKKHINSCESDYFFAQAIYTETEREEMGDDLSIFKAKDRYTRFVTLGEFLRKLDGLTIPDLVNKNGDREKIVQINTHPNQLISYGLDQSPIDPRVCIFNFEINSPALEGIYTPLFNNELKKYIVSTDNVSAGRLMNIYLNFDFIKQCLRGNTDNEGKLSLFKCLQSLCSGLNKALGGVNKLEPVIKDDNFITIIDQTPIIGLIEHRNDNDTIVPLEIFGHNTVDKKSNFVKNISLNTSITPDLAAMVTIGATAAGGSAKGIDATAFSKWNAGLSDRFNHEIVYPLVDTTVEVTDAIRLEKEKEFGEEWDNIITTQTIKRVAKKGWAFIKGYITGGYVGASTELAVESVTNTPDPSEPKYVSKPPIPRTHYTREEYIAVRYNYYYQDLQTKLNVKESESQLQKSYIAYLMEAFGGFQSILIGNNQSIPKTHPSQAKYFQFDADFINRAKFSYKEYLRIANEIAYNKSLKDAKKQEDIYASNQVGFIPIKLNITLQGIAGVKIYNKLNIQQGFLPSNYPKDLHFIITKVNHQVQDNNWETVLETISMPVTKVIKYPVTSPNYQGNPDSTPAGVKPLSERGPMPSDSRLFAIFYDNRKNEMRRFAFINLINTFHPDARPQFEAFFREIESNYRGYKVVINSIDRSLTKSIELKKQNPSNATPGSSLHNYNAAVDFNLVEPNGRYLRKEGFKAEWINSGVPAIARKHGLGWGGDFVNYQDDVHFFMDVNLKGLTINQIRERAHSLGDLEKIDVNKIKLS